MNGVSQFQTGSYDRASVSSFVPEPRHLLVLIAENDELVRAELRELLDLYSVGVLEAENGEEAVDLIVRECPNLVLMNSALPGLDGYEAAQLIRSIRSFDRMPLDFERLDGILENYLFRSDKFS